MKFSRKNSFNKKALLLLLIITFSNIADIKTISNSKNKSKNLTKFPFQNPLGNLAAGIGKSMVGGEAKFMACFPQSFTEKSSKKAGVFKKMLDTMSKILGVLATGLSMFLKIFTPIVSVICKNKNMILKLIGSAMVVRRRKFREEEASFASVSFKEFNRKYKSRLMSLNYSKMRWGLLSALADAKKLALKKIEDAKNLVITKVFNPIFAPIKAKISVIIGKIKSLFMGGFLGKLFKCAERMQKILYKFKPLFAGMFNKFKMMLQYAAGGAGKIVMFFVDILLAQLCDVKDFRRGLDMIVKGSKSTNENEKYWLTGRGLGLILKKYALKVMRV